MTNTIRHSKHSSLRAQQRCISRSMIEDTIHYGELIRKQGLRFFIMTKRSLCFLHEKQYNERLKNMVVVVNEGNTISTVYKNSQAMKNIRKKSKILY